MRTFQYTCFVGEEDKMVYQDHITAFNEGVIVDDEVQDEIEWDVDFFKVKTLCLSIKGSFEYIISIIRDWFLSDDLIKRYVAKSFFYCDRYSNLGSVYKGYCGKFTKQQS